MKRGPRTRGPRSTTTTTGRAVDGPAARLLDDDLDPLELLELGVAGGGHRRGAARRSGSSCRRRPGTGRTGSPRACRPCSNSTRSPRGSCGWCASAPQWKPRPGRVGGAGERRADHHRVGAAGDRLGDVAGPADRAVGDHVHVAAAGLVEVVAARGGHVGDRARPSAPRRPARCGWCARRRRRSRPGRRPRRCASGAARPGRSRSRRRSPGRRARR